MSKGTVRTTFVLPSEIAEKLKEFVPDRKRSEFVAEAIDQHLHRMVYQQGLELSFGKWKDEDYPHLRTQEDVERYIREMRSNESWRINQEKEK
jgi:hypothetical protein